MNPNPSAPPTPTPAPAAGPAPAGQSLVEFVRTQRQTAAYIFLALSVVFLAATIWLAVRSFRTSAAAADKPAATNPLDPTAPEAPKPEIADPKKYDYTVGWLGTLLGFLITAGVGAYLMVGLPNPSVDRQRSEARVLLLVAGGVIGFALIVFGGWYFYRWSDSLSKWLDRGEKKEMVWVVVPLLMVVGGAGLVFAAVQPARAEERNNPTLRRLVYGSNFGLTVLLLLVVLVVANVAIAKKIPNKLDTTETGFYTLSEGTKNFLAKLPEPITLYTIMSDRGDRLTNDIRQFAYEAQDASRGRLTVRFVSPVSNRAEVQRLQEKYPRIGRDDEGVLITAGTDEKRSAFVPVSDLFEMDPRGRQVKAFVGEGRVMREIRFLAENEQKPVIYFTQGNGELSIGGGEKALTTTAGGSANQLKAFLEKSYLDVRPLTFPLQNPTVPDDAAVVVVADPQSPLTPAAAGAIQKYMTEPRKAGGKGKLIVAAGATAGPDGRGVVKTGLEGVLSGFGVRLGDRFVYTYYPDERSPAYQAIAMFARGSEQNPITQALAPQVQAIGFLYPREVEPVKDNPQFQAIPLLITRPGLPTWLEDDRLADTEQALRDLESNEAVRARKKLTTDPRPLAVVVSESAGPHGGPAGGGRVLAIGNGFIFSDRFAERVRGGGTPATFDLMSVAIDWLRERPPLPTTAESKPYVTYTVPEPAAIDTTRLRWLPLGLGLLTVIGLGVGVWVIRRK